MVNFDTAEDKDFPEIVILLEKFFNTTPYKEIGFSEGKVLSVLSNVNNSKGGLIVVDRQETGIKGVLIAQIAELIFGYSPFATELAWWIEPEYRNKGAAKEWLTMYEQWCKEQGCIVACLQNLNDPSLDEMYTRKGYKCTEHTYMKIL